MQVILKVVGGRNDCREIAIGIPEFIIGRGEEAHLRPASDLISRKHCAIRVSDGKVVIEDFGSRNGTFVNGKQIRQPHVAKSGDRIRVGRLQFELILDPSKPGSKKSKVNNVVEAAARTVEKVEKESQQSEFIEDSISDWLSDNEEDDEARKDFNRADTVQFSLDESEVDAGKLWTTSKSVKSTDEEAPEGAKDEEKDKEEEPGSKRKKKKEFGKLPPRPKFSHEDSTTAAGDVLRKFFNRR
jgi:predicted component of type VI protein secretion system